jgi:hypothetical protein
MSAGPGDEPIDTAGSSPSAVTGEVAARALESIIEDREVVSDLDATTRSLAGCQFEHRSGAPLAGDAPGTQLIDRFHHF